MVSSKELQRLRDIATCLRRDSLLMTSRAGSGHPTSCLSCAEIMSALFFSEMQYDTNNAANPDNDEFILSKGHAAAILYSCLKHAGCISLDLMSYRNLKSDLEGHPVPHAGNWIKVATGSLGQGLSVGVGMAFAAKLSGRKYRTYVLLGDSEMAEGSNYEAMQLATHYRLDNICAIVDINNLGQRGETMIEQDLKAYQKRCEGFGWNVVCVDGHNISDIQKAFAQARKEKKKPTMILAKTVKGKGVSFLEGKQGWHGKALSEDLLTKALKELSEKPFPPVNIMSPVKSVVKNNAVKKYAEKQYTPGEFVATREAYGTVLAQLASSDPQVLALDAEVSNSTFSEKVKEKTPKQFVECYIAEQNMIGMALGLSVKGYHVFSSSFAAFLTRAYDQLRMAAISKANFTVCGSHCGVSIGEDGASQMGLEDLALFRSFPNSTVLYPSDAIATEKLVNMAAEHEGITYLRTTRPKTPVIYSSTEHFPLGDFKIVKQSKNDQVILVGAGITLHECLKAHELLKKQNIQSAVIDLYCIQPFDSKKFIAFVEQHVKKIVVSEDHHAEGGIGEMLASSLVNNPCTMKLLAVNTLPHSGKPEELLKAYHIDSESIVKEALQLTKRKLF